MIIVQFSRMDHSLLRFGGTGYVWPVLVVVIYPRYGHMNILGILVFYIIHNWYL